MHLARILELLFFASCTTGISREKWGSEERNKKIVLEEAIRNVQSRRGDEQSFFFFLIIRR
jgi:hypothetical protein